MRKTSDVCRELFHAAHYSRMSNRGVKSTIHPTIRHPLPSTFLNFLPITCLTVILINIPVRSAGGGLHGHSHDTWRHIPEQGEPRKRSQEGCALAIHRLPWRRRPRHPPFTVATAPSPSCKAREGRTCYDRCLRPVDARVAVGDNRPPKKWQNPQILKCNRKS